MINLLSHKGKALDVYQEAEMLKQVPMFSGLEPSKLKLLAFTSESVIFESGEVLFNVNDPSDCAYVVLDGLVEILAESDEGDLIPMFTRGQNELIGEMAVLNNAPRSATLRAREKTRVLRISNEAFLRLLRENPEMALDVMRQLSDKLAKTQDYITALQDQVKRYERGVTN